MKDDDFVNDGTTATIFDLGAGIDELIYESSNHSYAKSTYAFRNIETLTLASSTGTNRLHYGEQADFKWYIRS